MNDIVAGFDLERRQDEAARQCKFVRAAIAEGIGAEVAIRVFKDMQAYAGWFAEQCALARGLA